jgi:hypothetical protein
MVDLGTIRHALVGEPGGTGLSVEQRKRLTIAVELVVRRRLLHSQLGLLCSSPGCLAITRLRAIQPTNRAGRRPSGLHGRAHQRWVMVGAAGRQLRGAWGQAQAGGVAAPL